MRRSVWRSVVGAMSLLLGLGSVPPCAAQLLELRDDAGRMLRFETPPRRIVSLAPHATELLFAAGLGERVVAVDLHSDEPAAVRELPRLAALPTPDPERLLALRPDLVVVWGAGLPRERLEAFTRAGLPVFVSAPASFEDIASSVERLGRLSAKPAAAQDAAHVLRLRWRTLVDRHAGRTPVRVFVQAWSRPLVTLSDRDLMGDALRACGATNVFGDSALAAPAVDAERVLRRQPRAIVTFRPLGDREPWQRLGVLEPRGPVALLEVDAVLQRPVPRALEALEALCAGLGALR